jgi:glycosyltransferase involved in cell wall biosynthesis
MRVLEPDGNDEAYLMRRPSRPPLSYPLDLTAPLVPPRVDVWFGFNSLACAQGLVLRRLGRVRTVVYWCVDFVPRRFGHGPMTAIYDRLDGICCRTADVRFELSQEALDAREARHRGALASAIVVPMGAWIDRVSTTAADGYLSQRVVYLGHLVERQGVSRLLDAVARLALSRPDLALDIIGTGPLAGSLKAYAEDLSIGDRTTFHGFVPQHREVERILSLGSVAVAPYKPDPDSFTRFADPGKLKAYLAAGLPIVLTAVPPNARALEMAGAARIVDWSSEAIADAIDALLSSHAAWRRARTSSLAVAADFDWSRILTEALANVGVSVSDSQRGAAYV